MLLGWPGDLEFHQVQYEESTQFGRLWSPMLQYDDAPDMLSLAAALKASKPVRAAERPGAV